MNSKSLFYIFILILLLPVLAYSQKINFETKHYSDSSEEKRYYISVEYPQIVKYENSVVQKQINKTIENEIMDMIKDYLIDIENYDDSLIPRDFRNEFESGFDVYYSKDNIFSFSFDFSVYYAGAAHPMNFSRSMNFDMSKSKLFDFSQMFRNGESDLKFVSDYCYNDLKQQGEENDLYYDEEMVQEGIKPVKENYRNILVDPEGLIVVFDPYQVAPYVAGPQRVIIPYKELKKIIDPNGPLYPFIK